MPDEIPDVRTEPAPNGHGSGRSKARAQVPKPIPVDILLRATGPFRQNTDIENFVNDVASHYDVSDHAQAPGVRTEVLRAMLSSCNARCAMLPDSPIHCVNLTVGIVSPTFRFYCILGNISNTETYSAIL